MSESEQDVYPLFRRKPTFAGLIGLAVLLVAAACSGGDEVERQPGTGLTADDAAVTEQLEPGIQNQDGATAVPEEETDTPEDAIKIDADSEPNPDAALLAEQLGISLEEALDRSDLSSAYGDLNLDAQLRSSAGDTFAGVWVQQEPEFGIVVLFTVPIDDGERLVRPHIEGTPFSEITEVRQAQFTVAELEGERSEAEAMFAANGLLYGSFVNLSENRVEIFPMDLDLADALISDGTISLPPAVVILPGFITITTG